MTTTDPTASGWSVIEHAPPGPVALTAQQREEVRAAVSNAATDREALFDADAKEPKP
jgi:hypothetical protein